MFARLLDTVKRYNTLRTHNISSLPIAILMPHSACNCRCVMCDIWKGNNDRKQLTAADIGTLVVSFRKLGTRRVIMSGGEALLNRHFFDYCALLRKEGISITLLSTGLTLQHHVDAIIREVDEVIVSLDGDPATHDTIRNVPGAFLKMEQGIAALKAKNPGFKISGRCVIHRLNYMAWPDIVRTARSLRLDSISFLPADVTSEAFNREQQWDSERQQSVLIPEDQLPALSQILDRLLFECRNEINSGFILESVAKLNRIVSYYRAQYGLEQFPEKKCNAPWVSAVVEADGTVRPCFFHDRIGNIRQNPLDLILNTTAQQKYRRELDITKNETCRKCVCYLHLKATTGVT